MQTLYRLSYPEAIENGRWTYLGVQVVETFAPLQRPWARTALEVFFYRPYLQLLKLPYSCDDLYLFDFTSVVLFINSSKLKKKITLVNRSKMAKTPRKFHDTTFTKERSTKK